MKSLRAAAAVSASLMFFTACSDEPTQEAQPAPRPSETVASDEPQFSTGNAIRIAWPDLTADEQVGICSSGSVADVAKSFSTDESAARFGFRVSYADAYEVIDEFCADSDGDSVPDAQDAYPQDPRLSDEAKYRVSCGGGRSFIIDRNKPNFQKAWSTPLGRNPFCDGRKLEQPLTANERKLPGRASSIEYAYQHCVEHDTTFFLREWPLSESQAKEARQALALCPNHPNGDAIRARIAGLERDKQLRSEGRIFSSGIYRVGPKIQPGTYYTTNVENCYWERLNSAGAVIDNYFGTALRVQVSISSSDFSFRSDNCGTWRPVT